VPERWLAQSRLLRVSGKVKSAVLETQEKRAGYGIIEVPAEEFNSMFDGIKPDDALVPRLSSSRKTRLRR